MIVNDAKTTEQLLSDVEHSLVELSEKRNGLNARLLEIDKLMDELTIERAEKSKELLTVDREFSIKQKDKDVLTQQLQAKVINACRNVIGSFSTEDLIKLANVANTNSDLVEKTGITVENLSMVLSLASKVNESIDSDTESTVKKPKKVKSISTPLPVSNIKEFKSILKDWRNITGFTLNGEVTSYKVDARRDIIGLYLKAYSKYVGLKGYLAVYNYLCESSDSTVYLVDIKTNTVIQQSNNEHDFDETCYEIYSWGDKAIYTGFTKCSIDAYANYLHDVYTDKDFLSILHINFKKQGVA